MSIDELVGEEFNNLFAGFQQLWQDMAAAQNVSSSPGNGDPYARALNASTVYAMWERLDQRSLGLDFLGGGSCMDIDSCVGVLASDGSTCVCYASSVVASGEVLKAAMMA